MFELIISTFGAMRIFNVEATLEYANALIPETMLEWLEIKFTEIGDNYLVATMPVTARVHQQMGTLHGGATVALAESVGSTASAMCIDLTKRAPVGLEINANHIKRKRKGLVTAKATNVHLGRNTHIWQIEVTDEEHKHISTCRLTMMIIDQ